jgi:hypothetical protein
MSASASDPEPGDRIRALERQLLTLKIMLCLVLMGLAAVAYLAADFDRGVIRADRIELVDDEGKTRLLLGGDPRIGVTLVDDEGATRARLHLDKQDRPGLFLHADNADIGIAFNDSDLPAVEMRFSGRPRLTLGLAPAGGGLVLHGQDGNPQLTLQSGESVNTLDFGPDRLRLQSDGSGAAIQLQSASGSIRMASTPGQAPGINTIDARKPQP